MIRQLASRRRRWQRCDADIDVSLQPVPEKRWRLSSRHPGKGKTRIAEMERKTGIIRRLRTTVPAESTASVRRNRSIVVMDVETGQVLAMASYPSLSEHGRRGFKQRARPMAIFESEEARATIRCATKRSPQERAGVHLQDGNGLAGCWRGASRSTRGSTASMLYLHDENGVYRAYAPAADQTLQRVTGSSDRTSPGAENTCNYISARSPTGLATPSSTTWSGMRAWTSATGIELPGETMGMGATVLAL